MNIDEILIILLLIMHFVLLLSFLLGLIFHQQLTFLTIPILKLYNKFNKRNNNE